MKEDWRPPTVGGPASPIDAGSVAESTSADLPILSDAAAVRAAARALTAALLRRVGVDAFDRVDDAVQDAFAAAARRWPVSGVPAAPLAWLHRVAHRRYLDQVRAARRLVDAPAAIEAAVDPSDDAESVLDGAVLDGAVLADDQLRLVFMCAHPALSGESRLALTLRCVSQVDVDGIARVLRADAAAVAQRIVRAKRTLRDARATFTRPSAAELPARLPDVLYVVYALFTDGHLAADGDQLVRVDLCDEAERLAALLAADAATAQPAVHALHALILFGQARLPARSDAGVAIPLAEQDRTRWDRARITRGLTAFGRSIGGDRVTRYHLEAEIALLHTTAPSWGATPWSQIVDAYDRLLQVAPTPLAQLARVVAMAEAGRADEAGAALAALPPSLEEWPEVHAVRAEIAWRRGDRAAAGDAFAAALARPLAAPARAHLERRRAACLAEGHGA